jgi:predicted phage baseplate assembly protein
VSFREPTLDDRSFQDLVSEARTRVAERCPEWTEHNVSDPGITLIETFAWMTEMLTYRLNRLPERVHLALLDLLDIKLRPPVAASADLRFTLADAVSGAVAIPAHTTEVAAKSLSSAVFRVVKDFTIAPVRLEALAIQRRETGRILTVGTTDGIATPSGTEEAAFSTPPQSGDALYLGFREPLDRLVMRIEVDATQARGVGIRPSDPPLSWLVSGSAAKAEAAGREVHGNAGWVETELLEDTTGGFNLEGRLITLQMPERTVATNIAGQTLHWICCLVTKETRKGLPSPRYTQPPRIHSISARPVGALLRAEAATIDRYEVLGESDGTSGQTFVLRHAPALELGDDDTLQVREPDADPDDWVTWDQTDAFDRSEPTDRHFRFDPALGEVELGPAIRDPVDGWKQHGAVPVKGAQLRMTRYRHGGGVRGTLDAGEIEQLLNPISGVVEVTNPEPTNAGEDVETLAAARLRTAEELRTRYRAVTTEDYEYLAERSPRVARARCLDPAEPRSAIRVFILPDVDLERLAGPLAMDWLVPSDDLLHDVGRYLDARRIVGTSVHVMPVPLRAVTVAVEVEADRLADADRIERAVKQALYRFINPYVGGQGRGWRFGAPLNGGDVHQVVHDVPGVNHVGRLHMYDTDPRTPGKPSPRPAGSRIKLAPNELLCSGIHRVRARRRLDREDDD